jgi:hypothetical protein
LMDGLPRLLCGVLSACGITAYAKQKIEIVSHRKIQTAARLGF